MKIRHKLLMAFIITALVTSVLVTGGAGRLLGTVVEERYVERIQAESLLMRAWLEEKTGSAELSTGSLQDFAITAGARLGYRVTLIRDDGLVMADSAQDLPGLIAMDNHAARPEIAMAMREGNGESRRTSATTRTEYYYRALRVDGTDPVRIIRVALPTNQVRRIQSRYVSLMAVTTAVVLLAICALGYLFVSRLSKPMEEITRAAELTAGGDLNSPLPPVGDDEAGRLAAAVGDMRAGLLHKIEEIASEHRLMLSMMSGIREGLLLVGTDHRILMANQPLREIFEVGGNPEGDLLAEVVRNPSVIRHVEATLEHGTAAEDEIIRFPATGRAFEIRTAPVLDENGQTRAALALLFDITRLETLEGVRREFVSNVSHELRTPLTSIQAFVETLLEGGMDDRENRTRFLKIIRRHTTFMGELIGELSDLNKIETGAVDLDPVDLDLMEVAAAVTGKLAQAYGGQQIELSTEIPPEFRLKADRRRLEQILTNLVDNALKFNKAGGTVRIEAYRTREGGNPRTEIVVADDGVGIPSDCIERVFNRFYRVDQARSKDVSGTGLGLSIVKHLMRLHGGRVELASELGVGTRVTLIFPDRL
ncbi:MAG: HAMP domain-containing protein [Acidobacteria bacterium]|uniref:histidine kinase n=1 Tax=Candidatus Polarisedimenticola svalbardensis TaxID=2886004 RepID=A0A8J7CDL4_9BACT|nr:HAMP domain-containing protein [Candidatus Polarisedimenticola svalbardensis]